MKGMQEQNPRIIRRQKRIRSIRNVFLRILFLGLVACIILWNSAISTPLQNMRASIEYILVKRPLVKVGFVLSDIEVQGHQHTLEADVLQAANVEMGRYLFDVELEGIRLAVEKLDWVENVSVRRLWPHSLLITITERTPYALWHPNTTIYADNLQVFDAKAMPIAHISAQNFIHLPRLSGTRPDGYMLNFIEKIGALPDISEKIIRFDYIEGRRFDVYLKSGEHILLPEKTPYQHLLWLSTHPNGQAILTMHPTRIDLRFSDKVILRKRMPTPRLKPRHVFSVSKNVQTSSLLGSKKDVL